MKNEKIKKKSKIPIQTKYSRVRDHLDYFLGRALDEIYVPLPIEQIKERLMDVTEVNISVKTLKKDLQIFSKKYGENLLCQVGDRLRLNHCLYKFVKIKPPKGYPKD